MKTINQANTLLKAVSPSLSSTGSVIGSAAPVKKPVKSGTSIQGFSQIMDALLAGAVPAGSGGVLNHSVVKDKADGNVGSAENSQISSVNQGRTASSAGEFAAIRPNDNLSQRADEGKFLRALGFSGEISAKFSGRAAAKQEASAHQGANKLQTPLSGNQAEVQTGRKDGAALTLNEVSSRLEAQFSGEKISKVAVGSASANSGVENVPEHWAPRDLSSLQRPDLKAFQMSAGGSTADTAPTDTAVGLKYPGVPEGKEDVAQGKDVPKQREAVLSGQSVAARRFQDAKIGQDTEPVSQTASTEASPIVANDASNRGGIALSTADAKLSNTSNPVHAQVSDAKTGSLLTRRHELDVSGVTNSMQSEGTGSALNLPAEDPQQNTPSINLRAADAQQQFAQLVQQQAKNGVQTLQVQVYPQGLGSITVSVHRGGDGVAVQLTAANPTTAAWLQQDSAQLAQSVQSAGVQVASVVVGFHQQQGNSGQQQKFDERKHGASLRVAGGTDRFRQSGALEGNRLEERLDENCTISVRA